MGASCTTKFFDMAYSFTGKGVGSLRPLPFFTSGAHTTSNKYRGAAQYPTTIPLSEKLLSPSKNCRAVPLMFGQQFRQFQRKEPAFYSSKLNSSAVLSSSSVSSKLLHSCVWRCETNLQTLLYSKQCRRASRRFFPKHVKNRNKKAARRRYNGDGPW